MFLGCYGLNPNILSFQIQMAQFKIGPNISCEKETNCNSNFILLLVSSLYLQRVKDVTFFKSCVTPILSK